MTRVLASRRPLSGLVFALAAIALHAALSVPDPGPFPLPGSGEAGPEAPSCVGCHSTEWPSPAPELPAQTLSPAERDLLAQQLQRP